MESLDADHKALRRSKNITQNEKSELVKIIKNYIPIIEDKSKSYKNQRETVWEQILEEFNTVARIKRDVKQIKVAYGNMKRGRSSVDLKFIRELNLNPEIKNFRVGTRKRKNIKRESSSGDSISEDNFKLEPKYCSDSSESEFVIPPETLSVEIEQVDCANPLSECEDTSGYNSVGDVRGDVPTSSSQITPQTFNNVDQLKKEYYEKKLELVKFELKCKEEMFKLEQECKTLKCKLLKKQIDERSPAKNQL